MTRRKAGSGEVEILTLPAQRMAVVHTVGDPNAVGPQTIPALYGSVYTLKFALRKAGKDFTVGALRARWHGISTGFSEGAGGAGSAEGAQAAAAPGPPTATLRGDWGLPIPAGTRTLPQKQPGTVVQAETWQYGTVAQALHVGPYTTEAETIRRLREAIAARGYTVAGPHEEEYLTRPTAKVVKTLIRYPIRRKRSGETR